MKATIEISMYPLSDDYIQRVLDFLEVLNQHKNISVETNGLSTQIFGEYDDLMDILKTEMFKVLIAQNAIFILKIGKGILRYKTS
ncbi:MAG: YkoF family thiamine/hydroxymethylpyrimidine-binding protein [Saprospiraceae bacterium]